MEFIFYKVLYQYSIKEDDGVYNLNLIIFLCISHITSCIFQLQIMCLNLIDIAILHLLSIKFP